MTRDDQPMQRHFRIWVEGRLSRGFASGLEGVDERDADGGTILTGPYVDESHLQGVLDHLRGLAIGVRRFEVDAAPGSDRSKEGVR